MLVKHRVRIHVSSGKERARVLEGGVCRLPARLVRWLLGDFTEILVLKPGESVECVEVCEVPEGRRGLPGG